jgi:hypothetical protein
MFSLFLSPEGVMRPALALASLSLILLAGAVAPPKPPRIEGTYRLVSRDLPDGSKQVPPAINGLNTYTKGYRNFNIYWEDAHGKLFSVSYVATYRLTAKEYRENSIFFQVNDEIGGKGVSYDLSSQSAASPVTVKGMRVQMQMPLHGEPEVAFEGNKMTATGKGVFGSFVDHWERVP